MRARQATIGHRVHGTCLCFLIAGLSLTATVDAAERAWTPANPKSSPQQAALGRGGVGGSSPSQLAGAHTTSTRAYEASREASTKDAGLAWHPTRWDWLAWAALAVYLGRELVVHWRQRRGSAG